MHPAVLWAMVPMIDMTTLKKFMMHVDALRL